MMRNEWIGVIVVLVVALALGAVFLLPVLDDSDCRRSTSFYDSEENIPGPIDVPQQFEYQSLSPEAQRVFDRAREDGRYSFSDGSKEPPEFSYSDEAEFYGIAYRNQTDYLVTAGCAPN